MDLPVVCTALLLYSWAALSLAHAPPADTRQPVPARVDVLLATLATDEKIPQTFAAHTGEAVVRSFLETGLGAAKYLSVFHGSTRDSITARNALQEDFLRQGPGIPVSFVNEGLHGGAAGGTIFPMVRRTAKDSKVNGFRNQRCARHIHIT